jgi:nitrate reductase cytochrome c-type subunit|tara:strand:+ start:284 stop:490 length:207 start_codon:yes stop_codon:yes gene_type:complete
MNTNMCLACHSKATAASTGAPTPGDSHFQDRDGNPLDDVSGARYFCAQCHVRRVVADPLVSNTYQGGK